MKVILIRLVILSGCVEEANITINNKSSGTSTQPNTTNDETQEDDTPSNNSTTLLYDFSDPSLYSQNFNFT